MHHPGRETEKQRNREADVGERHHAGPAADSVSIRFSVSPILYLMSPNSISKTSRVIAGSIRSLSPLSSP